MTTDRPNLAGLPTRIRLVEPIGTGGSATVWRARDTQVGRDLAVKVIGAVPGVDPALRGERLEREGRALTRLRHVEGVVALHEIGVTSEGTAWIVMDLAAPGSLRDRFATGAVVLDTRALGARLATTLAHAHFVDVVHGDISPANVLFDALDAPLLVDFNMAAILGEGRGAHGPNGCTPAYAAPERLRGAPPDRPSDVHALAATLAEVAGRSVLDGSVTDDAVGDVGLVAALASATSVGSADRPTASEFAVLLGVSATDLPGAERRGRAFRRRR